MPVVEVALASASSRGTAPRSTSSPSTWTTCPATPLQDTDDGQSVLTIAAQETAGDSVAHAAADQAEGGYNFLASQRAIVYEDIFAYMQKAENAINATDDLVINATDKAAVIAEISKLTAFLVAMQAVSDEPRQHTNEAAKKGHDDNAWPPAPFRTLARNKSDGGWIWSDHSEVLTQLIVRVLSWRDEVLSSAIGGFEKSCWPSPNLVTSHAVGYLGRGCHLGRGLPGIVLSLEQQRAVLKKHKDHWQESTLAVDIKHNVMQRRHNKTAAGRDMRSYYRTAVYRECGGKELLDILIAIGKWDDDVLECMNEAGICFSRRDTRRHWPPTPSFAASPALTQASTARHTPHRPSTKYMPPNYTQQADPAVPSDPPNSPSPIPTPDHHPPTYPPTTQHGQ